jgi:GTP cyclohydrolase I
MTFNAELIKQGVRLILQGIGDNPERDGIKDTPDRVARFYEEWFAQPHPEPKLFKESGSYNQIVAVCDIAFASLCEHHMLPFIGVAHVGYIPGDGKGVLGLSKIARYVQHTAQALQVQERLTETIADRLSQAVMEQGVSVEGERYARPTGGVMVVLEAEHMCMSIRGIRKPGARTITSALRGVFARPEVKDEFLRLIARQR